MQRVTPDMAGEGTVRSSMVSYGDHGELEHVNNGKCDELA